MAILRENKPGTSVGDKLQERGANRAYTIGNAVEDGMENAAKGWFIGHFVRDGSGLRRSRDLEVKWGEHQAGEQKRSRRTNERATTLTLLISGRFVMTFPRLEVDVILEQPGDYVIFAPGVEHKWHSETQSIVVTVRWPSVPNDSPNGANLKP